MTTPAERFDLLCLGRLGVDLYSEQEGTPLSSVETFVKYVGGSAANVCVGVSRLGLSTAMCSRVGDEEFGEFVLKTLSREGINTDLVQRDPVHPTGVVALALYKREHFPRIFFYTTSADLAFEKSQIDWNIVDRAGAVLITGSYLLNESLRSSTWEIAKSVRDRGGRVVLDVDYRPVLWGIVPVGRGNDMETGSPLVTEEYQRFLPLCNLIVGTEEEIAVAGGSGDVGSALANIRSLTDAAIVLKRGAFGASVFDGPIPANLEDAIGARGYTVDVLNNTGAGDAFLSGFLSRWLRNRPFQECIQSGNASGAIVVTRNGCAPAMPFAAEHARFMDEGNIRRPDDDELISRLHRMGTRRPTKQWNYLVNLEDSTLQSRVKEAGGSPGQEDVLRQLYADAIFQSSDLDGIGIDVDATVDIRVLEEAIARDTFVTKFLDIDLMRPDDNNLDELIMELRTWPSDIDLGIVSHVSGSPAVGEIERQLALLSRISKICRRMDREIALEVRPLEETGAVGVAIECFIADCYRFGVEPDYWRLPEMQDLAEWMRLADLIRTHDISCRGFFVIARSDFADIHNATSRLFDVPGFRGCVEKFGVDSIVLVNWLNGSLTDAGLVSQLRTALQRSSKIWTSDRTS